jgi:hypothetical protein
MLSFQFLHKVCATIRCQKDTLTPAKFFRVCVHELLETLYETTPTKCTILLYIILQLKYYNSNMFRPSLGHLQGVHINYMNKT